MNSTMNIPITLPITEKIPFNTTAIPLEEINLIIKECTMPREKVEEENSEIWHTTYHGGGKITFKDGTNYEGTMEYGVMKCDNEKCKFSFENGIIYEGTIKDNKLYGNGDYYFPSGAHYSGDILNGLRHGKGVYKSNDDQIYDGSWKNGKKHGYGKLIKGNMIYEGEFKEGYIDGFGRLTWDGGNGDSYEGYL